MGEVHITTPDWLGGLELRFEGQVTGKVEIREVGQEWTDIEKVEGTVTAPLVRSKRHKGTSGTGVRVNWKRES